MPGDRIRRLRGQPRRLRSRLLTEADRLASRPGIALTVVAADAAWVVFSVVHNFPSEWELVFQSLVAALTLAMVFVIQHTQARQQAATNRKLDEILRALPGADNALIHLEHASDAELRAARQAHLEIRQVALGDQLEAELAEDGALGDGDAVAVT